MPVQDEVLDGVEEGDVVGQVARVVPGVDGHVLDQAVLKGVNLVIISGSKSIIIKIISVSIWLFISHKVAKIFSNNYVIFFLS